MIILFKGDMFTPSKLMSLEKLASQKKSSLADFPAFSHHFLRAILNYMHGYMIVFGIHVHNERTGQIYPEIKVDTAFWTCVDYCSPWCSCSDLSPGKFNTKPEKGPFQKGTSSSNSSIHGDILRRASHQPTVGESIIGVAFLARRNVSAFLWAC